MSIQIPITPTVPVRVGRSAVTGLVVTVFGASGFVARNLISRLGGMGAQVIVPYRSSEMDVRHLKVHGELGNIINLKIDMNDKSTLKRAVEHSSIVFNLIGRNYGTKRYSINEINVNTAAAVAEAVSEMNIDKFVHFSALGASPTAHSAFLRAKFESENVVRNLVPKTTIIRPATLFGLRDSYLNRIGWMSSFLPFFPLPSETGKIQPLYITDLIDSLMHILDVLEDEESRKGKTYSLAGPSVYTHEQIYKYVNIVTERDRDIKKIPRFAELLFELSNFQREPTLTRDMLNMMKDNITVPEDTKNTIESLINTRKHPLTDLKEVVGTLVSHWKTSNDYYHEPGSDKKDLSIADK